MASLTKMVKTKRRQKLRKQGRKRKRTLARKSTQSAAELFGDAPADAR